MYIIKTTGEPEKFSRSKFVRSIMRAGAKRSVAEEIATRVLAKENVQTTHDLHKETYRHLRQKYRPIAARYDLKRAIMELGPSGYPFEKLVAGIFAEMGYTTQTNQILVGSCVRHEVDVLAQNNDYKYFIECKYHSQKGARSNIKVALYIKARFDDLRSVLIADTEQRAVQGIIVTNTQFSRDAEKYARCVSDLKLISWNTPKGHSLAQLIDQTGLHPVSTLTTLTRKQKLQLMKGGVVFCRDLVNHLQKLQAVGVSDKKRARVITEARAVCALRSTMEDIDL